MSLQPDIDQGAVLQASTWSLTALAFVFLGLRFWARFYKRAFGIDDAFMLLSWLFFLGCTIAFNFIATSGGTRPIQYLTLVEIQQLLKLLLTALPMAIVVTSFGKMAIGVTILRIVGNTSPWKKWSVWAMLTVLISTCIVDIFLGLFRCGDPRNQWDITRMATAKCLPSSVFDNFNLFTVALQAFSDYFFSILPMVVVWNLNMKIRRKFTLIFLLGLTLVTGAVSTAKLPILARVQFSASGLTGDVVYKVALLFSLEAMFIIVFGSMPVLNPLWEQCVEIRKSRKMSGLTWSSKLFSLGSSKTRSTGQVSKVVTAPHDSKWLPDSSTELARLTGYPEQPPVLVHGGGELAGYPQQSTANGHDGGEMSGYPQQSAVFVHGGGGFPGYPQQPAVLYHGGGEHPVYSQQLAAIDPYQEGYQDERWSHNQPPGSTHIQQQAYQNIYPQQSTHGTHGY